MNYLLAKKRVFLQSFDTGQYLFSWVCLILVLNLTWLWSHLHNWCAALIYCFVSFLWACVPIWHQEQVTKGIWVFLENNVESVNNGSTFVCVNSLFWRFIRKCTDKNYTKYWFKLIYLNMNILFCVVIGDASKIPATNHKINWFC